MHINKFFAQSVNLAVSFYMLHPTPVLHQPIAVYTTFTVSVITSWTHFNIRTVPDVDHSSSLYSHSTSTFGLGTTVRALQTLRSCWDTPHNVTRNI